MNRKSRILLVDDDLMLQKLIASQMEREGFAVQAVGDGEAALQALQSEDYEVLLLDVNLGEESGLDILKKVKQWEDAPEVVMLTSDATLQTGIQAMRLGAYHYLTKPANPEEMGAVLQKAAEKRRLVRQNANLKAVAAQAPLERRPNVVIHRSRVIAALIKQAESAARLDTTILITGESGTGKDVLARHAHAHSARSHEPVVTINCGALPETLFESEFFGHERGSFTGASGLKRGIIETADGGTLFLDEIGDMPLIVQVKLLHLLEHGTFRRIGSTREHAADVRIIAATNRNLLEDVDAGRFRADLFYRLNVISLHVPALRERPDDIELLARHFLGSYRQRFNRPALDFSPGAVKAMEAYRWPGNIRELRNSVERAVALAAGDAIEPDDLHLRFIGAKPPASAAVEMDTPPDKLTTLDEVERRYILRVLDAMGQNRDRAATVLGITSRTLYRKLQEYSKSPADG
jgi:DNA-binding NtrC family response regulator